MLLALQAHVASSSGNWLCSRLRFSPGHSSTPATGQGKQRVTPQEGKNELLGWAEAVTGHRLYSRENSIPAPPGLGPSSLSSLTSSQARLSLASGYLLLLVTRSQPHLSLTCVPVTQAVPFTRMPHSVLTPTHTSKHLLNTPKSSEAPRLHLHSTLLAYLGSTA